MYLDLFRHQSKPANVEAFVTDVKKSAQQFLDSHVSRGPLSDLHEWYFSDSTQESLIAWFDWLWPQLLAQSHNALPAHDKRHALLKVPASAVECIVHEKLYGAERLGVVGAILHDTGRWAEEFIYGCPTASVFHARLSYLLSSSHFLKDCPVPADLKNELLFSVLTHTTGTDEKGDVLSKVVVSADRAQLVGPEYILRNVHHLAMPPHPETILSTPGKISISDRLALMAGPLPEPFEWLRSINEVNSVVSLTFCAILEGDNFEQAIAPYAHRLRAGWIESAIAQAKLENSKLYKSQNVQVWLDELLATAHISPNPQAKIKIKSMFEELNPQDAKRAAKALAYFVKVRNLENARLNKSLTAAKSLFTLQEDFFLAHVTKALLLELATEA